MSDEPAPPPPIQTDMDRSLDEILAGKSSNRQRRGGNGRRTGDGRVSKDSRSRRPRRNSNDGPGSRRPRSRDSGLDRDLDSIARGSGGRRGGGGRGGHTIMISNLFYNLNESDLDELFGRIGPIKNIKIQYDKSGRSEGYAWVTFEQYEHALEAVGRFDGKRAAGQTIGITMAKGFGFEPFKGNEFSSRIERKGRGGRRGGHGREETRSERRPRKTAEDLDAELDAYMGGPSAAAPADTENNEETVRESDIPL